MKKLNPGQWVQVQVSEFLQWKSLYIHKQESTVSAFTLTGEVAALDAPQVWVDPEQLPHLVVDGKCDRFPQTTEEQNLTLCTVQCRPLDLRRTLQQVGEVHVPVGDSEGVFN